MATFSIRPAILDDAEGVARLLQEYVRSELEATWLGSVERLRADGFGDQFELLLACDREVIGLVAFAPDYDLHVCVRGGRLLDLYVQRPWRGRGVAAALLAGAAREISERGGQYMKGHALPIPKVMKFYNRCAVSFQGPEFTLSARAFRHFAGLAGRSPRELVANLPEKEWNFIG